MVIARPFKDNLAISCNITLPVPAITDAIFTEIRGKALICARPTRVLRVTERRLTSIIRSGLPHGLSPGPVKAPLTRIAVVGGVALEALIKAHAKPPPNRRTVCDPRHGAHVNNLLIDRAGEHVQGIRPRKQGPDSGWRDNEPFSSIDQST